MIDLAKLNRFLSALGWDPLCAAVCGGAAVMDRCPYPTKDIDVFLWGSDGDRISHRQLTDLGAVYIPKERTNYAEDLDRQSKNWHVIFEGQAYDLIFMSYAESIYDVLETFDIGLTQMAIDPAGWRIASPAALEDLQNHTVTSLRSGIGVTPNHLRRMDKYGDALGWVKVYRTVMPQDDPFSCEDLTF